MYKNKQLSSINELLERFKDEKILEIKGIKKISRRPIIALEAYAITLFPALQKSRLSVPETYLSIIKELNGAHFFDLDLFGELNSSLITRDGTQPLSLETANTYWKYEFKGAENLFHFGGSPLNDFENIGYFINTVNQIEARLKDGTVKGVWSQFDEFLREELPRCEEVYQAYELSMKE